MQRTDKFLGLGLKDLTKQLRILGDTAFTHGHYSSIWLGELTDSGQLVAVKISAVQITGTEDVRCLGYFQNPLELIP